MEICFDKFRAILNVKIFFIASSKQARERCTSFDMLQLLSPPKCAVFTFSYLVEQTIAVLHLLINYEWDLTRKSKLNNFLHVTRRIHAEYHSRCFSDKKCIIMTPAEHFSWNKCINTTLFACSAFPWRE